jgi:hypothetical protein
MIRFCFCGRPLAAHAHGEKCEKPRVRVSNTPVLGAMPETTGGEVQADGRGKTGIANIPTGANSTYGSQS